VGGGDAAGGPITKSLTEQYPAEMAIVVGLVAKHDDFDDFLDACMASPQLESNDDIIMNCGDKALLWTELKG
jgi:hypothetical protein